MGCREYIELPLAGKRGEQKIPRSGLLGLVRGVRSGWRSGRGDAGDGGAEAEFLERDGLDFASRGEAFGLLEILHGGDGSVVPLAGGFALVEAFTGEGLLDFRNARRFGRELAAGAGGGLLFFLRSSVRGRGWCGVLGSECRRHKGKR